MDYRGSLTLDGVDLLPDLKHLDTELRQLPQCSQQQ